MSDTESTAEEADELEVTDIKHIGETRAEKLGIESVDELAAMETEDALEQLENAPSDDVVKAVRNAREALGLNPHELPKSEATEAESFDDANEFIDATTDPELQPEDCESVLVIGGDGAFDHDGEYAEMDDEEKANLVSKRLVEQGFTNMEELWAPGSGMSRIAVNAWVGYQKNEGNEDELPDLNQVSVNEDNDLDWSERYAQRNKRLLEEADGVCVIANGDYVGMWVNMVQERDNIIIRTPERDVVERDEIPEFEEHS